MKIAVLITTLLCFSLCVNAQSYAIIRDSDGYTNVRKEGNSKSAVVGKIYGEAIFSYVDEGSTNARKSDWVEVYQMQENGSFLEGYVHKSRFLPLSTFKSIANPKRGSNYAIINNDSITIKVMSANL